MATFLLTRTQMSDTSLTRINAGALASRLWQHNDTRFQASQYLTHRYSFFSIFFILSDSFAPVVIIDINQFETDKIAWQL